MTLQLGTADVIWAWMTRVCLFSTSFLYSFEEPNPFIPPSLLGICVMSCAWPFRFNPSGPRIEAVEIMCNSTLMACVVLSGVLLLKRFHLFALFLFFYKSVTCPFPDALRCWLLSPAPKVNTMAFFSCIIINNIILLQ